MPRPTKINRKIKKASATAKLKNPEEKMERIRKILESRALRNKTVNSIKKMDELIEKIFASEQSPIPCQHYLIGAASFGHLMRGTYDMFRAHGHLTSNMESRDVSWKISEENKDI